MKKPKKIRRIEVELHLPVSLISWMFSEAKQAGEDIDAIVERALTEHVRKQASR